MKRSKMGRRHFLWGAASGLAFVGASGAFYVKLVNSPATHLKFISQNHYPALSKLYMVYGGVPPDELSTESFLQATGKLDSLIEDMNPKNRSEFIQLLDLLSLLPGRWLLGFMKSWENVSLQELETALSSWAGSPLFLLRFANNSLRKLIRFSLYDTDIAKKNTGYFGAPPQIRSAIIKKEGRL